MDEEDNVIEVDESMVIDVKWRIVKYIAIFIIFVFTPLMITILTSNSLSKLNIFAGFTAITLICLDQVINLSKFVMSVQYVYEDDEEENN